MTIYRLPWLVLLLLGIHLFPRPVPVATCRSAVAPAVDRSRRQLAAFIPKRLTYFTPTGEWAGPAAIKPDRPLEPLALSHALLASGDAKAIEQANFYLANAHSLEWHRANYVLVKYKPLLTEKSQQHIRQLLDEMAPEYLSPGWDFVGINDNFPAMATAGCAIYGQISGNRAYIDTAYKRLVQYKNQLARAGVGSEYSSQAYCFLQVEGFAMLAELTQHAALKKLALQIEERLWLDILGHYYLPAQKMAAPYSRAYAWDMRGSGLTYAMLDQVLGEHLPFRYLDDYFDPSEEWIKCRNAACYGIQYHCPAYLVSFLLNRRYPYSFIATADGGPGSDDMEMALMGLTMQTRKPNEDDGITEYGAWQTRIETYMTARYALSSSVVPFHSGAQTENFLLVYPRHDVREQYRNTATVFARLVINDDMVLDSATNGYGDHGIVFNEKGRRMAIQDKNTVMVLYKPKAAFHKGVRSLRSCVFIPNTTWMRGKSTLDELWLGDQPVSGKSAVSTTVKPIFIKDGPVYMAYFPLISSRLSTDAAVTIEADKGYTILSFYNYRGKPKDFAQREFINTGNGFVCETASADEYPSFAAFRKAMSAVTISDTYRTNIHYRSNQVRHTRYSRQGLVLDTEYSPVSESIRFITVNGQYQTRPRLQVSGLPLRTIPFLAGSY